MLYDKTFCFELNTYGEKTISSVVVREIAIKYITETLKGLGINSVELFSLINSYHFSYFDENENVEAMIQELQRRKRLPVIISGLFIADYRENAGIYLKRPLYREKTIEEFNKNDTLQLAYKFDTGVRGFCFGNSKEQWLENAARIEFIQAIKDCVGSAIHEYGHLIYETYFYGKQLRFGSSGKSRHARENSTENFAHAFQHLVCCGSDNDRDVSMKKYLQSKFG